jgi:hypothetical protein
MNSFFCCDCRTVRELDRHGRCSCCGSDAIDIAVRPAMTIEGIATTYVGADQLEALWLLDAKSSSEGM